MYTPIWMRGGGKSYQRRGGRERDQLCFAHSLIGALRSQFMKPLFLIKSFLNNLLTYYSISPGVEFFGVAGLQECGVLSAVFARRAPPSFTHSVVRAGQEGRGAR